MTFDELMNFLTDENRNTESEEVELQATELILEVLNTGADVLNRLPQERLAGILALVQSSVFTGAMTSGDYKTAALAQMDDFTDALMLMVQATAGILTMEEIR